MSCEGIRGDKQDKDKEVRGLVAEIPESMPTAGCRVVVEPKPHDCGEIWAEQIGGFNRSSQATIDEMRREEVQELVLDPERRIVRFCIDNPHEQNERAEQDELFFEHA